MRVRYSPITTEALKEWLLERCRVEDGHWLWTGTIAKNGYGMVKFRSKFCWVHRLAAHAWLDLDLSDAKVLSCHKRECLRRDCFNPNHLYVGTYKSNNRDTVALGRYVSHWGRQTHCVNGHAFTPENTFTFIRNGSTRRECRACRRIKCRRQYAARKALYGKVR